MAGSAEGASTRQKACQREASSVRMSFSCSGSTEARPSTALTTIGKKQTSAMMSSLGVSPNPNQITSSGATTTSGTAWEAISSG